MNDAVLIKFTFISKSNMIVKQPKEKIVNYHSSSKARNTINVLPPEAKVFHGVQQKWTIIESTIMETGNTVI